MLYGRLLRKNNYKTSKKESCSLMFGGIGFDLSEGSFPR